MASIGRCTRRLTNKTFGNQLGRITKVEKLWVSFFSDPSEWWDNTPGKDNPKFPDFIHKHTKQALWLVDGRNPPWVASEMTSRAPGTLQMNAFSWARKLSRCNKAEQYKITMELFQQMRQEGITADRFVFVPVLNACAGLQVLEDGRLIHKLILENGCESDPYVSSSLVDMYAKCGSMTDAWMMFNKMSTRGVVAWTAMIRGYVNSGQGVKALDIFQQMQEEGVVANSFTFVALLNACASIPALEEGRRVHGLIRQFGWEGDTYVDSSLVDMYIKCGSLDSAWIVFNKMHKHNLVAWNAVILGHVSCGQARKALEIFQQMQVERVEPNSFTFVGLLNACASIPTVEEGRYVHEQIRKSGCEFDVFVGNSLVDMYAKCGSIDDAWAVFNKMPKRGVVAWNAMIFGHVNCGLALKCLELFQQMQLEGIKPDSVTFVRLLNACTSLAALEEGRRVHEQIRHYGWELHPYVGSSLVSMYARCGSINDAWDVFSNLPSHGVITWTAMILGYVKCGQGLMALKIFREMKQEGVEPNSFTFVGLLKACASLSALDEGRRVHEQISQRGLEFDAFVGTALVDMYAKCGSIEDASSVFNMMPTRDVVIWNAMILGLVNCRQGLKALNLLQKMRQDRVEPNCVTFVALLNACATLATLKEGRLLHGLIRQSGCEFDAHVGSSLVDMYSKCGSIDDALTVFNTMPARDGVAWTTMIRGCAMHGRAREAVGLFEQMVIEGAKISDVTFVCLLSACSHGGLVKEGIEYFESMKSVYGVSPNKTHYTCMIDLLGRAGRVDDALDMIKTMPLEPDAVVWMSLLGTCTTHGRADMGEHVAEQVLKLNPKSSAGYVLLSNMYAAFGHSNSCEMITSQRFQSNARQA